VIAPVFTPYAPARRLIESGVAVALASQKSLENIFGAITLFTSQPVRVGDFCRFGDKIGTVEEIADVIAFLLSPSAGWITGETIAIDGGRHLTCLR